MNKVMMAGALVALLAAASACNRGAGNAATGANASTNATATTNGTNQASAGGAAQASAAAESEVRTLLDEIYAPYATDDAPGRDIGVMMEPQLAQKLAQSEEGIDVDPFIDAQDYAPFRPEYQSVRVNGDRAEAVVRINSLGQRTINYVFVRTPGGWKIADVGTARTGTLRGRYDLPPME